MRPLAIDLCAGLGGWSEGLIAEGFDVIGFDIEQHIYGEHRYPAQLVIQDVLTLHGSQFKDAALIVASPPCQEYSYMAMPWKRAKAKAAAIRADQTGAELERLNRLFNACFRIQREANEANGCAPNGDCIACDGTGNFYRRDEDGDFLECDHCNATGRKRHIPLIVENVKGAIPWVGRSRWNFGSYHLWGDVPALMPTTLKARKQNREVLNRDGHNVILPQVVYREDVKVPGFRFDGSGRSFQSASVAETGVKAAPGMNWSDRTKRGQDFTRIAGKHAGLKGGGDWFGSGDNCSAQRRHGSKSPARKAASAMIARIPEPLARHIARCFLPGGYGGALEAAE